MDITNKYATLYTNCSLDGSEREKKFKNLILENPQNVFSYSVGFEVNHPIDEILGGWQSNNKKIIDAILKGSQFTEAAKNAWTTEATDTTKETSVISSVWSQIPAFKGAKPIGFSNSINFVYFFNMYGSDQYGSDYTRNSKELIQYFAPSLSNNSLSWGLQTSPQMLGTVATNLIKNRNSYSDLDNVEEATEGETQAVADLREANLATRTRDFLKDTISTIYTNSVNLRQEYYCQLEYGALKSPIFIPKSFSITYKMDPIVEEKGIRYPGSIIVSLQGCQTVELAHQGILDKLLVENNKNKEQNNEK